MKRREIVGRHKNPIKPMWQILLFSITFISLFSLSFMEQVDKVPQLIYWNSLELIFSFYKHCFSPSFLCLFNVRILPRLCCPSVVAASCLTLTVMVLFPPPAVGLLLLRQAPGSWLLIGGNASSSWFWWASLSTTAVIQPFDSRLP